MKISSIEKSNDTVVSHFLPDGAISLVPVKGYVYKLGKTMVETGDLLAAVSLHHACPRKILVHWPIEELGIIQLERNIKLSLGRRLPFLISIRNKPV